MTNDMMYIKNLKERKATVLLYIYLSIYLYIYGLFVSFFIHCQPVRSFALFSLSSSSSSSKYTFDEITYYRRRWVLKSFAPPFIDGSLPIDLRVGTCSRCCFR